MIAELAETSPKALSVHLALSALSSFIAKQQPGAPLTPTEEALRAEAQALLPTGTALPEEFSVTAGEASVLSRFLFVCIVDAKFNVFFAQSTNTYRRLTEHGGPARRSCRTGSHQDYHQAVYSYQWLLCY